MKYDIEIPKRSLQTFLRVLSIGILMIGLVLLGQMNSPMGEAGLPRLLTPRLAQVTGYLRNAQRWAGELHDIQNGLSDLLSNEGTDLLSQDSQANELYARLSSLQSELDGTNVPPTLGNLQDAIQSAVDQSMHASLQTTAWIGKPTSENHAIALMAYQGSKSALQYLYANPWMMEQP